jgi:peptide/nickel transport system substrate-binding protein
MTRRRFLGAAGAGLGAAALAPFLKTLPRSGIAFAQGVDTMIYGMASPFDTLDTTTTTSSYTGRMGLHVVDPLVWSVKAGEYAPSLATSWTISPDATAYTFNLRDDVKFHDGTPFNAEAVKVTFDRIVDPATKAQTAFSLIGPYDRTEVLGPHQVRVRFKKPYAAFLNAASTPYLGVISPTALRRYGQDFGPVVFVSTGPFSIQSYQSGQEITLIRNINYNWASRVQKHNGPPYLQRIVFRIITEPSTRLATLETGETHFIEDVPPSDLERVKRNQRLTVIDVPQAGSGWSVMFNQQRPPTNELAVRRAFQLAIDKEGLAKAVWDGVHKPACSPFTPNIFGFDPETCKKYPRNVDQARRVLEEAGWQMGPDGIRVKGGQKLTVNYYFRTENPKLREMTAYIQSQMKPVGVDVQLIGQAGPAYFQSVRTGLHHVQYWWDTGTDPGQMLRVLFHSSNAGGGTNRNNYRNAEMDALIDTIGAEANPQKRRELLVKAQQKVLDEQVMVFLTDPPSLFAHQKTLSGVWVDWGGLYPYFYDARLTR